MYTDELACFAMTLSSQILTFFDIYNVEFGNTNFTLLHVVDGRFKLVKIRTFLK